MWDVSGTVVREIPNGNFAATSIAFSNDGKWLARSGEPADTLFALDGGSDRIIIDGILSSPGVQLSFGAGMRRAFAQQYANARARSEIRTSLLPSPPAPAPTPRVRSSEKRNRSAKSSPRSMVGTWRITRSELWDREALDLVEPAFIHEHGAYGRYWRPISRRRRGRRAVVRAPATSAAARTRAPAT